MGNLAGRVDDIMTAKSRPRLLHSRGDFLWRVFKFAVFAISLLALALGFGVWGYHHFAGLPWVNAFMNASMILGGMGAVDLMPDDAAKIFASFYALMAGALYPVLAALVLYPIVHRMMNILHVQSLEGGNSDSRKD
jgi:hypothetical protein